MKKIVLRITLFLLLVLLGVSVVGCAEDTDGKVFDIHTETQNAYLNDKYDMATLYAKGDEELSKPVAITLSWNMVLGVKKYQLYLSEYEDFSISRIYDVNKNKINITNVKIDTQYFWHVEYQKGSDTIKTPTKTFFVNGNTPRNLDIDGLTNVRDLGGYKTADGKTVKQGLVYRSSRLNENETTDLLITEKGIQEMLDGLKVKTELDVRDAAKNENGGITTSPLGESVNYFNVSMRSGGNYLLLNREVIKDVFSVFGDESNYPIVIHCSIGTDRTGLICFFINALLGVGEEDLYRDYMFSNFGNIGRLRTVADIEEYLDIVNSNEGSNLSEKTYNYLLSIGVDSEDLDTIIKVMK